jgi:flagellar protein FliS
MANLAHQEYRSNEILSAGQEELLLKLYAAAIASVKLAINCIEISDKVGKAKSIGKAVRIVNELLNALDPSVDNELTSNLERLYLFVTASLAAANTGNNKQPLEAALQVLGQLYDGWEAALQQLRRNPAKPVAIPAQRETGNGSLNADRNRVQQPLGFGQEAGPAGRNGNISIIT